MKAFVLLLCSVLGLAGCSTTVRAVPLKQREVVVVKQPKHRKSRKVVVVAGTRVKKRPQKSIVIYHKNIPYYYVDGVFYKFVDKVYEVIRPKIGMIVPELPKEGVVEMRVEDELFYVYDGVMYKEVPTKQGIQFEVRGFINK